MFNVNTKTSEYMTIVVTHLCNRRCPFCVDKYRGLNEYITLDDVDKALNFASENKIKDILLVGGEPTLHPQIVKIASMCYNKKFNIILTTNYSKPEIVRELDKFVNSFNISYYGQENLPNSDEFSADITLSTLIHKKQLKSKKELDKFIDEYSSKFILKFSTLVDCNDWTRSNKKVNYLDKLDSDKVVLFDEMLGQIYRGCVIKRYDKILFKNSKQSYKCLVNGLISTSWDRD